MMLRTLGGYLLAVLVVTAIAIGQLLFKLAADQLRGGQSLANVLVSPRFMSAIALYAVTTVAWLFVLKRFPLSRIYPVMALTFVIVPLASYLVLREPLSPRYWLGLGLLVTGILVILSPA